MERLDGEQAEGQPRRTARHMWWKTFHYHMAQLGWSIQGEEGGMFIWKNKAWPGQRFLTGGGWALQGDLLIRLSKNWNLGSGGDYTILGEFLVAIGPTAEAYK